MNAIRTTISTFGTKKNFNGCYSLVDTVYANNGWIHRKYDVSVGSCNFTIDVLSQYSIDGLALSDCVVEHTPTIQRFTEAEEIGRAHV